MEVEGKVAEVDAELGKGTQPAPGGMEGSAGRMGETVLRCLPIGLCAAAMVVMLRNSTQSEVYGPVSYSDLGGFQYLVYANGVCAAYSLASAFFTFAPSRSSAGRSWALYFFDQVLTYMVLTAAAASVEILNLAYRGNKEVTWSEACGDMGGFCGKAKVSVGITFAAVACYVVLSVASAFRLFSSHDPPIRFLRNAGGVASVEG